MAQTTSARWKALWRQGASQEYGFEINGVWYGPEAEISHSVESGLYEELSIGNAAAAKLTLSLLAPDVPRGAEIRRYVRLRGKLGDSEWLPKGVFYVNSRSQEDGRWTVEAFDGLRKAEARWIPEGAAGEWPRPMDWAVAAIAVRLGMEIDPRTQLKGRDPYVVDYPNELTMREVLCHIAAAHGGNWTVTGQGQLLLVPLAQAPEETNRLVNQLGDAITLGGVSLLV